MPNNYDKIAFVYDRLSRIVYSNNLINAQLFLLSAIPPCSKILIVGGGTGWILDEISKLHPSGLSITYVESSANMMLLSRKRAVLNNVITFIQAPIESVGIEESYDVILTPFLFDNFMNEKVEAIFNKIDISLVSGGVWLYADFQVPKNVLWQKAVLKIMYVFFRVFCSIEARLLPETKKLFIASGYETIAEKTFFKAFIVSTIYRKYL